MLWGDANMDVHTKVNLELWNRLVDVNAKSDMYNLEAFMSGKKTSLSPCEVEEIGKEVSGKSIVHLQCHFGMDTLSLARLGARNVIGVDFSPVAVSKATELAKAVGLGEKARFVCSDIYDIPNRNLGKFDLVYTGGGALSWLKDLRKWGEIVSSLLRQKGIFYLYEFHPFSNMYDEQSPEPRLRYPYFHGKDPIINKFHGTYSEPDSDFQGEEHCWDFGMGEVLDALIGAGLQIRYLHEFTSVGYKRFPFLKKGRDNRWRWKDPAVPLEFSLMAERT